MYVYIHIHMYIVHCVLTTYSSWPLCPPKSCVVSIRLSCSGKPQMPWKHRKHSCMFIISWYVTSACWTDVQKKKLLIFHMYFTTCIWYVQHVRRCLALPLMSPPRWDQLHPWRHRALNQRCWIPCCQVKHSETTLRSTDSTRINHLFWCLWNDLNGIHSIEWCRSDKHCSLLRGRRFKLACLSWKGNRPRLRNWRDVTSLYGSSKKCKLVLLIHIFCESLHFGFVAFMC